MMKQCKFLAGVALLSLSSWLTMAFSVKPMVTSLPVTASTGRSFLAQPYLQMASEGDGEEAPAPPVRKRKRKRKAGSTTKSTAEKEPEPVVPTIELKPRDDTPVKLQVQDVRQAVSGIAPTSDEVTETAPTTMTSSSPATPAPSSPVASTSSSTGLGNSFESLLEDARRMKEEQDGVETDSSEGDGSMKSKIRNALSTIVTADFFVVCAFLLWFLVGIFCSSVLKDDTVQIAFNSNFQAFVQPALGLLMIGSIAGNFFEEEGEEGL